MAITLIGSGGLFTRLGHDMGVILDLNVTRGSTITAPDYSTTIDSKIATILTDYAAGTQRKDLTDGLYGSLTGWKGSQDSLISALVTVMQNTLAGMVNDDAAQADSSYGTAMAELCRQLISQNYYVVASSLGVGALTASGSPTGTPAVAVSTLDAKGFGCDYMLAETFRLTVTVDAQNGGVLNNEQYSFKSQSQVLPATAWNWPSGSASSATGNLVDPTVNNSAGNLLQNSDFETVTNAHIADNWIKDVGTLGTDIDTSASAYTGSKAMTFIGDGATLSSIYQPMNTTPSSSLGAGGTLGVLKPSSQYPYAVKAKVSATPAAGIMEIAFTDSSGTILVDGAGNDCKDTFALTAVSTSYVNWTGALRTPASLPAGYRLRIRLSTALENGKNVIFDHVGLAGSSSGGPAPLYQGGPTVAFFSGVTPVVNGDSWTLAFTNTWGAWQQAFQRVFNMRALGLRLQTKSGGNTVINANLIA